MQKAALQLLGCPIQLNGEVRGSNGQGRPAEIVVMLAGRFDLGYFRAEDGTFNIVVDLWGVAKRYNQTELINGIAQEYERLKALDETAD